MNTWTNEDIESILTQLNNQLLPFKGYTLIQDDGRLELLGRGSSANVYKAKTRKRGKAGFAIKVIGFGNGHVESESFGDAVDIQETLAYSGDDVVEIHDSTEIIAWIEGDHTVVRTEVIGLLDDKVYEGNFIHLQFIVMEEISPVLSFSGYGKPVLQPCKLQEYDEEEIIKLAYEIGTALQRAHEKKLLHRDVKLENIFYSAKDNHYKLGDFGIAKIVDDGMASTVAFTKGYGAPEVVGTLDDKYDYTADIYSFGMLLYVLLNELRFPESKNYHPNIMQYTRGFAPQYPTRGSDELCRIVLCMISFNPDDRYQSMEEVLNEFIKLKYGSKLKYQIEHRGTALAMGAAMAIMAMIVGKFSFFPYVKTEWSRWIYMYVILCIIKAALGLLKEKHSWIKVIIFALGIFLTITTGFTWWKIAIVLVSAIFSDILTGIVGLGLLVTHGLSIIALKHPVLIYGFFELKWLAIALMSLAVILLMYSTTLELRSFINDKNYYHKNVYWIAATFDYVVLALYGLLVNSSIINRTQDYWIFTGFVHATMDKSMNPTLIGLLGAAFCVIWMARENLVFMVMKRLQRYVEAQRL